MSRIFNLKKILKKLPISHGIRDCKKNSILKNAETWDISKKTNLS